MTKYRTRGVDANMKSIAKTHEKECICSNCYHARVRGGAAARERDRIRRLIGPALNELRWHAGMQPPKSGIARYFEWIVNAIDAATRPEAKRKKAKGTR